MIVTIGSNMGNGPWRSLSGAQLHSYQRNQPPTTPDQKGQSQKDKEAGGEQLATGMRGRRKVKTIIRFARVTNRRLRSSFSTHSARPHVGHAFSRQIVATESPSSQYLSACLKILFTVDYRGDRATLHIRRGWIWTARRRTKRRPRALRPQIERAARKPPSRLRGRRSYATPAWLGCMLLAQGPRRKPLR